MVEVVAAFDAQAGQNPENLTLGHDQTAYVTWLFAHAVVAVHRDGRRTAVTLPAGEATGVAIDPGHPDELTVGMISSDPAVSGIWTVPLSAFAGTASPKRRVALPVNAFPNGLAFSADGTLYIADSARGAVLRVAAGASNATTWSSSPLLTPTGAQFQGVTLPGANGVKLHGGALYATNTSRRLLIRIPFCGAASGTPAVVRSGLAFDDFAIDDDGVITAALNITDQVVRFAAGGPITVLADKLYGNVQNPSAVALGPHGDVYVTSAAYFGTQPALQLIRP